jgi:small nuclear ribonucleoprotein
MVSAREPQPGSYLEPSRKPLNLLIRKMNGDVAVKLKNDTEYRGKMIDCDSHMNIILDGAREYRGGEAATNYGSLIVRGSNVLYITVAPPSGS